MVRSLFPHDSSRLTSAGGLGGLSAFLEAAERTHKLPPVETWNPPFCGDLDIRIAVDGSWHYLGTPIGRAGLVRLFSTILRREDDGEHYLVTPVEKVRIRVDDAPFVAVLADKTGEGPQQRIQFTTNVGDTFELNADHGLRVNVLADRGEPRPYVRVRGKLDALVSRAVFYELVNWSEEQRSNDEIELWLWSAGERYLLGNAQ